MYAVRINPDSACKPKLRAPGEVWVTSKGGMLYGLEPERLLFRSVPRVKTWEMVVKVEVEK